MWISSIKAAHRDSTKRQPACPFMRIFSEKEKQSTMRSFQSRKYHFHFLMSQALPQVFFVQKETEHILRFDFDLFFILIVVMMINDDLVDLVYRDPRRARPTHGVDGGELGQVGRRKTPATRLSRFTITPKSSRSTRS